MIQARTLLTRAARSPLLRSMATAPAPKLFGYEKIRQHILPSLKAIHAVENAFGMLAKGLVDVPIPMHIGIHESKTAGPGDCHVKGGYIEGALTWTVKLANVSFYRNLERGLPPGSGVFIVCCANTGAPLGIFQENRYLTDLRTGAAGAIAVKHCASKEHENVVFIGTGAIAQAMAENTHCVHKFKRGYAFGLDPLQAERFANITSMKLGYPIQVCNSAEEAVRNGDVVFTQTTASAQVLRLDWLRPHATIIASGSDQSTKNEIPPDVMAKAKMICDLKRQCARVGELRTALQAKVMTEEDVYAELGEVVNGTKPGRVGRELILVDLTGTGAQDAAIGQVAWDTLSRY